MDRLTTLPNELFCLIVEQLVMAIGIYKATMLRPVSRAFDAAIQQAIYVSQVVDIEDPAYSFLPYTMPAPLKGKIYAVKSRSPEVERVEYLLVIANVNRALDALTRPSDELRTKQHERIAEAVADAFPRIHARDLGESQPDIKKEAQNLLSGAIVLGDLSLVKSLQANESSVVADVNGLSPYFGRPLAIAASWGHLDIVQYLLHCGADPHLTSYTHEVPLEDNFPEEDIFPYSAYQRYFTLGNGNFSYKRPLGSPLPAAVLGGHEEIVHLLLEPKFLSLTEPEYFRAIVAGARSGNLHLIELLLQKTGRNISQLPELGQEILWEAIRHNRPEVVQMLLSSGMDANSYPQINFGTDRGTLSVAAAQGNAQIVRILLSFGAEVNCYVNRESQHPVECAARCGQEEVVRILLEQGADSERAFMSATAAGQTRVVKMILDKDPDLLNSNYGETGRVALHKAILAKNPSTILLLVNTGVSLNEMCQETGWFPLDLAREQGAQWIVDYVISLGAENHECESEDVLPDSLDTQSERNTAPIGGVRVTKRTWEWVGKY